MRRLLRGRGGFCGAGWQPAAGCQPAFRQVYRLPAAVLLSLLALPLAAQPPVGYELRFPNAVHHEAEIRATFSGVAQPVLEVLMSRSSPGRYSLHDFAKNVYNFRATDGRGNALEVARGSPTQWNVSGHKGTVVVEYTLFGDRADGTYAAIDSTHAHLNGPATFVWAHGFENSPATLAVTVPEGSGWTVATQLAPRAGGGWTAPNLDRLMDAPLEISRHIEIEWTAGGERFRLALHHHGSDDEAAAFARVCAAVAVEEEGVFGAFPKFDDGRYTFLVDNLPYVDGDGMEHRDSTSITGTPALHLTSPDAAEMAAHEFFHSWNVKRIRPRSLEPFDYERANMSGELWFAEGFTNYYGMLTLKRAGLENLDRFGRAMAGAITRVLTAPGRLVYSPIDMSRQAPFVDGAGSAVDPINAANNYISYYTYGQALALGIDLAIRARFPGKSLDDWMRQMWLEHPDIDKPYTLDDLERTLATAAGDRGFAAGIFRRHIYGKEPMEYEALLAHAGLLLEKGGRARVWLGASSASFTPRGMVLNGPTLRGSPLYEAGLDRDDRIVEWDGHSPRTEAKLEAILARHKPGDRIRLRAETRTGRRDVDVVLGEPPDFRIVTYESAGRPLTREMAAFREAWLASKAIHPVPKVGK